MRSEHGIDGVSERAQIVSIDRPKNYQINPMICMAKLVAGVSDLSPWHIRTWGCFPLGRHATRGLAQNLKDAFEGESFNEVVLDVINGLAGQQLAYPGDCPLYIVEPSTARWRFKTLAPDRG